LHERADALLEKDSAWFSADGEGAFMFSFFFVL